MKKREIDILMKAVADGVRGYVEQAMVPLIERNIELEERMARIEKVLIEKAVGNITAGRDDAR